MRALRRVGFVVAALLVAVGLYYGSYLALRGPRPGAVLVIAHRGGAALAPENTLAAFRLGVAAGADYLEFDVQLSRDGVPVVFHDATLSRLGDPGRVQQRTLAELQALDAGAGQRIPTLTEVLTFAAEHGVGIMPEAKLPRDNPGLEQALIEALERSRFDLPVVLQSFDRDALARLHAFESGYPLCMLVGLWELRVPPPMASTVALCPMAEMVLLNPWMVRQAQRQGLEVYVWFGVLDGPWSWRVLRAFGVDGLMVDDPAALAAFLDRSPD